MRAVRGAVVVALAVALVGLGAAPAAAQPSVAPQPPAAVLRDGNAAAIAGDWRQVTQLVGPLLRGQLAPADLAEAHRLAGLAAFFEGRTADAETHFLGYLRIDLDGQLDPALYPPEAILFFNDTKAKHSAELRARRPTSKRYWVLNLVPPFGQFQNGERVKGYVVGGLLGGFLIGSITSYVVLRSWCTEDGFTCDEPNDRVRSASQVRTINTITGIGAIVTYVYGVYDGTRGYRRRTRERSLQPFITSTPTSGFIGVAGQF